jgi:hypothetical protein
MGTISKQCAKYHRIKGRLKWTLQGDDNMVYFHALDNGRQCKCAITSLFTQMVPFFEKPGIHSHIYNFLLMGTGEPYLSPWCMIFGQ